MRRLSPIAILAILAGIALVVVAVMYFGMEANDLPSFIPGHEDHVGGKHPKRGIAAAVVAVVCFAYAWMTVRGPNTRRR
jgi:drug/metabolite transporter (DMT)-like permease